MTRMVITIAQAATRVDSTTNVAEGVTKVVAITTPVKVKHSRTTSARELGPKNEIHPAGINRGDFAKTHILESSPYYSTPLTVKHYFFY